MIEQMVPWLGEEERWAMDTYLSSGGWLTEHAKTCQFESAIADYVGSKYCIATTSGTTALYLALVACGIGQRDKVLVPAFTQTATAGAVELAGARPVLADINAQHLCLDMEIIKPSPGIRAIMLVSLNGRAPDMVRAREIADEKKLYLIEDAAQSLGSRWNGKCLGTFGHVGCYSFSSPKVITTGQGGAIVTDDADIADRARHLKTFGTLHHGQEFGVNFKFTDLQAVVGIEQMKKLAWRLARKRDMFRLYRDRLADIVAVKFLDTDLQQTAPWFIDILVPDPADLQDYLYAQGIGTRRFYQPLRTGFPNAEYTHAHGLWLPSSSFLDDRQIAQVCDAIGAYYHQ